MKLIILFGTLLIAFTLYWKYTDFMELSFNRIANNLKRKWRDYVNDQWVYFKTKGDTLYMDYGRDHKNYADIVNVPDIDSYSKYIDIER